MAYHAKLDKVKDQIITLYRQGWSTRAIGEEFFVTREAVRLRLEQWGERRRKSWEHPARKIRRQ